MSDGLAPRPCEVVARRDSGAFRILSLIDREGPEPAAGQFYRLTRGGSDGGGDDPDLRPGASAVVDLSAARVALPVAETRPALGGGVRLDFLLDPSEPGGLAGLDLGETVRLVGPLGDPLPSPRQVVPDAAGAILVGSGVEVAPLALLRRRFAKRAVPHRVLLGFRDAAHTGGLDLFCGSSGALCPEVRLATEDGHAGVRGGVTDLLLAVLAGNDAVSGVVYAAGPAAMLEAVRGLCADRGVHCEVAENSPDTQVPEAADPPVAGHVLDLE